MKGRDLIIFILQNNLEDKDIFIDNCLVGFMSIEQAAVKFGVGQATVEVWCHCGAIPCVQFGETFYIYPNAKRPVVSGLHNNTKVVKWTRVD